VPLFIKEMDDNNQYYFIVYSSYFIIAIIFSFLINSLFLRFAKTLGIRNQNDGTVIRWASQSKPAVGGFSFYIIFLLSITAYSVFFNSHQVFLNKQFIGFLLATMLGFLLGLADDAYDTRPFLKVTTQLTCAILLIVTGTVINISSYIFINYAFTLVWVIGIMNSLNMLDNMDAIAASVSIMIIIAAISMMIMKGDMTNIFFIIMTGIMAALLGFLYFNWHPSKMFMGDTGSQFLGILLAFIGIRYFWNVSAPSGDLISTKNLVLPLIVFIMPLVDTTVVVIRRLSKKRSPFIGGKDHTTHALAFLGMSDSQVAFLFISLSCLSIFFVIVIERIITEWNDAYAIFFGAYFLAVLVVFLYLSRLKKD
jgi:UDP-GlcNAc:undecaprenyl-phosphate/decaprenyl-phosphate GlcNAc-1-phosphate transferase